jgi:hypothetical protein
MGYSCAGRYSFSRAAPLWPVSYVPVCRPVGVGVSKLASPVAKEAATGAGCAKPLDKRLLSDFGDPEDRLRLLAKAVHLQ